MIALLKGDLFLQMVSDDPIQPNRIYLVIKRPHTWVDYMITLLGSPTSSVSMCINGTWMRFTQKKGYVDIYTTEETEGFIFLDTGVDADNKRVNRFKECRKKEWSLIRCNCVTVWNEVLDGTPYRSRPYEWIPSIYFNRIVKELRGIPDESR